MYREEERGTGRCRNFPRRGSTWPPGCRARPKSMLLVGVSSGPHTRRVSYVYTLPSGLSPCPTHRRSHHSAVSVPRQALSRHFLLLGGQHRCRKMMAEAVESHKS